MGFLDNATRAQISGNLASSAAAQASSAPDRSGAFMFATGIECSNPKIGGGAIRRDLLAECGHYDHWEEDFALVRDLGVRFLRYGLPNHLVHLGPGHYDWSFADMALAELRRLRIEPILDLMHFGLPDWLGDFQNPDLPLHFQDYAAAVAARYPWVRLYTPINEMYVTARISAKDGLWNEQLRSDQAFVTAIKHLVAANILATRRIVAHRPDAVIIHSESAEYIHQARQTPVKAIDMANKERFIALDLLFAKSPCADIWMYLADNGLSRAEYEWFMQNMPAGEQILGMDYYGRNEHIVTPSGRRIPCEDVLGWSAIAGDYHTRYGLPMMHTETNMLHAKDGPAWLWKQWINLLRIRERGVPMLGFTWYSLTDQVDWDIALAEKRGHVNGCGLYDLNRRPNPVAQEYKALIEEFGSMARMPFASLALL
jgi:beta-glucosidase/6-phospho-beta-glucosidase/beta-galactosidase